ncbi:hypothetical protein PVAP13_6KG014901 [Panicum virgatum]|uniref:Uncharacterized protein n=1 Tax=Panicum virgatum TaxID=38727 RepID=A0A8T0R775_PANVG|nr:hypothetical protein PVAP13_6KG014901 [Panicum virgatum]
MPYVVTVIENETDQLVGSAQTPRAAFDRPSARGRLRRRVTAVPARAAIGRWQQRRYACRLASQGPPLPPAATTGLSSESPTCPPGHHGGEGGEGADTEEPATACHTARQAASPPARPRRRKPGPTHPVLLQELPTPHGRTLREGDVWFLQVAVTSF